MINLKNENIDFYYGLFVILLFTILLIKFNNNSESFETKKNLEILFQHVINYQEL